MAEEPGTTPGEIVRLMFRQMVKRRAIPFPLQAGQNHAEPVPRFRYAYHRATPSPPLHHR